jgi:hypothetical protein
MTRNLTFEGGEQHWLIWMLLLIVVLLDLSVLRGYFLCGGGGTGSLIVKIKEGNPRDRTRVRHRSVR